MSERDKHIFNLLNALSGVFLLIALRWSVVEMNPLICLPACIVGSACCLLAIRVRDNNGDNA